MTPPQKATSEKRCKRCIELKPRSVFKLRNGVYDYLCSACRRLPFTSTQLKKRFEANMLSEDSYTKQKEKMSAARAKAGAANLRQFHYDKTARHWDRAERSARFALKLLTARPVASEQEHEWCEDVKMVIRQSLAKIEENKHKRVVPDRVCLFWYDVDAGIRERFCALIAAYPGGEGNSPLKAM